MKFLVIEGNVVGGHKLRDMGVSIGYKEETRLLYDRAIWSSDLTEALQKGYVTKVSILQMYPEPNPAKRTTVVVPPKRISRPKPPEKTESTPSPQKPEPTPDVNESLVQKLEEMATQQAMLMAKIQELLTSGVGVSTNNQAVGQGYVNRESTSRADDSSSFGADDEIFIPSQIRGNDTKASDNKEVKTLSTKSTLEDSLAALKKKRKK